MIYWDAKDYIMTAGVGEMTGDNADLKDMGLVAQHSYGIVRVKKVETNDGQVITLCKVRNPWGRGEWNGDWSDSSPLWDDNEHIKEECEHTEANDGFFWMDFNTLK